MCLFIYGVNAHKNRNTLTHSYTIMPISMDGASFLNYMFVFMGHEVHSDFVPRNQCSQLEILTVMHHLLTYRAEPFLRSHQLCSCSRTQHFMEPEGSLLCSQEPSTGPYPKPYRFSLYVPSHPISLRSILILSTHLHLGLLSGLFPSVFPTNIPMHHSQENIFLRDIFFLMLNRNQQDLWPQLTMIIWPSNQSNQHNTGNH
jgi:hypothetical protein